MIAIGFIVGLVMVGAIVGSLVWRHFHEKYHKHVKHIKLEAEKKVIHTQDDLEKMVSGNDSAKGDQV